MVSEIQLVFRLCGRACLVTDEVERIGVAEEGDGEPRGEVVADLSDVVAERDHGVRALDNAYRRVGGRLPDALDLGLEVLHRLHEFVGGVVGVA